jgi:mannosyltransferase OCH1-like enzyme
MEAGATVVLEAMSYGLPVICRNTSGLKNAIGNKDYNYLCKDETEMFKKLLLINNVKYNDISKNNILKILNKNNEEILFTKLINEIKLIYDYEIIDDIPNIIHYVYGLKKQTEEFSFVYYLSILSNYVINKPFVIYFHYQYLPYGYWWDKALKYLKLNYINTNNIYWGKKKIIKFAHKADKIRLDILLKYGGIYMDIDTITYKPYKDLLKYDFVIGIQEENYGENNSTLYCNAILFSKKNNIFIKKWIEEYENHFISTGWCEASVHLPELIFNIINNDDKKNIKILDKEYFYSPLYNEVEKIFENIGILNNNLLTLHLWNTYSEKYYKNILNFDWCYTNKSLYSLLIKNILNIYSNNKLNIYSNNKLNIYSNNKLNINDKILDKNNINEIIFNKIYNISIITIFNNDDNYKNLLYSIANQEKFYKLNLELIIIDNTLLFNDIYNNDIKLKKIFIEKNFDIKIIKLNVDNNIFDAFNIGIINCKYDIVSLFNINDIIIDNGILFQCYNYENLILGEKNKYKILCSTKYKNINILNNNFINNIYDKIEFNIINLIINKKYINYYFPNKNIKFNIENNIENNIIFFIINTINENYVYFDNNVITYKENILFNYKSEKKIINNIFLYDYYDLNNDYIEFIKEIYNY